MTEKKCKTCFDDITENAKTLIKKGTTISDHQIEKAYINLHNWHISVLQRLDQVVHSQDFDKFIDELKKVRKLQFISD